MGMDGDFTHLRTENEAADAYEIANVQQFLKYYIINVLVFARTDIIARDVNLDSPFRVLQFHKRSLAHDAAAHDTAGDADLARFAFSVVAKVFFYFFRKCICFIFCCGIRVDTHLAQLLQAVTSYDFLFAQF